MERSTMVANLEPMRRPRAYQIVVLGALLGMTQACTVATTPSPTASTAPSPTATPVPTLPADAAPPELKATWTTLMGPPLLPNTPDIVSLTISDLGYSIQRNGSPEARRGRISVNGDEIEFSQDTQCPDGVGTYRWEIDENGMLTFTEIGEPDPCERAGALKDHVYDSAG